MESKTESKTTISLKTNYPSILTGDFNCMKNLLLDKHLPVKTYPNPDNPD